MFRSILSSPVSKTIQSIALKARGMSADALSKSVPEGYRPLHISLLGLMKFFDNPIGKTIKPIVKLDNTLQTKPTVCIILENLWHSVQMEFDYSNANKSEEGVSRSTSNSLPGVAQAPQLNIVVDNKDDARLSFQCHLTKANLGLDAPNLLFGDWLQEAKLLFKQNRSAIDILSLLEKPLLLNMRDSQKVTDKDSQDISPSFPKNSGILADCVQSEESKCVRYAINFSDFLILINFDMSSPKGPTHQPTLNIVLTSGNLHYLESFPPDIVYNKNAPKLHLQLELKEVKCCSWNGKDIFDDWSKKNPLLELMVLGVVNSCVNKFTLDTNRLLKNSLEKNKFKTHPDDLIKLKAYFDLSIGGIQKILEEAIECFPDRSKDLQYLKLMSSRLDPILPKFDQVKVGEGNAFDGNITTDSLGPKVQEVGKDGSNEHQ